MPVPPLSLPDLRRIPDMGSLPRHESVRLFLERAAVRPNFALTGQNAGAVARVCYRLDGIPLAIELAAARTKVLSVEEIAEKLDDSFEPFSSGGRRTLPRQRTLRATMDWSHELLPEEEQILFRRLSVFVGGFSLEAAECVSAGHKFERDEVLGLLSQLVDKSLVTAWVDGGETRYRILEMVRHYAREKLEGAGEAAAAGLTSAEVAKKLFLSSRTVGWHLGSIYRKLGLHSRTEAARFASEHGLL